MSEVIMFWTILAIANAVVLLAMIKISGVGKSVPLDDFRDPEPQWVVKWALNGKGVTVPRDNEAKP